MRSLGAPLELLSKTLGAPWELYPSSLGALIITKIFNGILMKLLLKSYITIAELSCKCLRSYMGTDICRIYRHLCFRSSYDHYLFSQNRTTCISHKCRKTTLFSCHRCLISTGVEKIKQHLNIDQNFDHQMSLSKSKCWYSSNNF